MGNGAAMAGEMIQPKDFTDYPQVTYYNCEDPGHHKATCVRNQKDDLSLNLQLTK